MALHSFGPLKVIRDLIDLTDANAFAKWLAPLCKVDWVVYARPPFGGPEAVLACLSRYTHRVASSTHRLVSADADTVAFKWKDYRIKRGDGKKVMRLPPDEFIRRFLRPVLPDRFHRIRHYGFLAGSGRNENVAQIRALLGDIKSVEPYQPPDEAPSPLTLREPCPDCGGPMRIIETFQRGQLPQTRAPPRKQAT
ncbi:Putative transposase (plasmid) [Phaeobacter piscinae]|nr:Putative transposase [Phaeobacter piscinae]